MQISLRQSYWTVCSTTQNFLPDLQLANKQYLLFLFGVGWKHKGIHWGAAVLQYFVVQTLQLQFEGMYGERLDLFIVWFQLFEAFIVKWISLCIVQ